MRNQSRMERGFMFALLSASQLLALASVSRCPLLATNSIHRENASQYLEKQSACQRSRLTNTAWKWLAEWEITPFQSCHGDVSRCPNCRNVGIPPIRLDEPT